ncbi:TIGR02285 family protein [Duganella guangzhouensis]|uniref:TIGR02285 family protein n=1 Tax=Duganella guangzhouensis TaxID=2666084 RepID=UPI0018A232A1
MRLLPFAFAALLSASLPARAAETITWLMSDFPPVGEQINGQPGNGMTDQVVKYLIARWPEATHRYLYANPNRVWSMLAAGEHACFASALRTPEREKVAYFRNAYLLPPPQLVYRPETQDAIRLNRKGEAELPAVLRNASLRGLVVETRSYGAGIDALLADPANSAHLKRLAPGNYGRSILTMLAMNRADYTIEMDFVMTHARAQDATLTHLKTAPLAGGAGLMVGGIACPRNAWGRNQIRHIDQLLASPEGAAMLSQAQMRWISKETTQRYGAAMKDFFRQLASPQEQEYHR